MQYIGYYVCSGIELIQTVFFFINRKNIIVVYCFGTEFVKFTVREIKD